ncbi:MAG: aldo/keto reductase [Chloroflexota bacterium]
MRLPLAAPNADAHGNVIEQPAIDETAAVSLIREAIDRGVNYVDTAHNYHLERSELVVAKALRDGYRQRTQLATKLPVWLVREKSDFDRLLDTQLAKLETDHIDFYLMHALNGAAWDRVKALGAREFLDRAVSDGRIRFPSFSFHDDFPVFKGILGDYDWSMCQIQLNYMDENAQAGVAGLRLAGERGIPVVIMEPLLGGKLAKTPPPDVAAVWNRAEVKRSPAEWAFRWVSNFPEVAVVLSGMNSREQLLENLCIFDSASPGSLTPGELSLIGEARDLFRQRTAVACTGCRYCMPCPQRVNIPLVFELYNEQSIYGTTDGAFFTYDSLIHAGGDPSKCAACGQCEAACPQKLDIIAKLKEAHTALTEHRDSAGNR